MPIFREGTTDSDCWSGIVGGNEYNLPDAIHPDALIVDIGTHIGSFVQACWNRGARRIISYEADRENYNIATLNVSALPGVSLFPLAVGRSDDRHEDRVRIAAYERFFDGRINTGSGTLFSRHATTTYTTVDCIRFDLIQFAQPIEILKIDCEGSEWPILYTSKTLDRVKRIVGEYHSIPREMEKALDLRYECNRFDLEQFLYDQGFKVVDVQKPNATHAQFHDGQEIGLFSASR